MRKIFFIFVLFFTFFAPHAFANVATNTGFIPGQIWYSKEPLVEGDTVDIYTAVWNSDINPLSIKVEFYDKNTILGARDVIVASMQLKDVYISWKIISGEHVISAKIISSSIIASGKKENITVGNNITLEDKQFVPVTIKTSDGKQTTASDIIQNGIDQVGSKISDILPVSVSESISNSLGTVDEFRDSNFIKVNAAKVATQKELDSLNPNSTNDSKSQVSSKTTSKPLEDATQKPIAYIKLFILSVLSFILGNKIAFYGLSAIIVFLILRAIYRKIRNR
jgi:hypothetical protein